VFGFFVLLRGSASMSTVVAGDDGVQGLSREERLKQKKKKQLAKKKENKKRRHDEIAAVTQVRVGYGFGLVWY
jgi:IS5 family transposase